MASGIYQHFRASERKFIDQASDWLSHVLDTYGIVTTDFLNPRQVFILQTLVNREHGDEIQLFTSSAIAETEYVKAILAPAYYQLEVSDFEMACLQIDFPNKFVTLKHSQILGTLLSQTGLERSKIGDIILYESHALVFVEARLVPLFKEKIVKIAKSGVKIRLVDLKQFVKAPRTFKVAVVNMSSVRLDKAVASVFRIARTLAQNLIQSNQVKVNYAETTRNDFEIDVGDLISVRGHGRFNISQMLGMTKRDNYRVEVQVTAIRK